jgi:lipopolysaccharide/colanic/teichoic acid biosynthesis glycosyltransferase
VAEAEIAVVAGHEANGPSESVERLPSEEASRRELAQWLSAPAVGSWLYLADDRRWQRFAKRGLDIIASLAGIIVLSLPCLVVAIAIRIDSPGPIIYRQQRVGQGGRRFTLFKFRSMVAMADDLLPAVAESNGRPRFFFKMRSDPRKTRVGQLLRRFSLDEMPQLFNVLKGDISLVGPRPPLQSEVEAYTDRHWLRLQVPQGMTGLWQVSGRSELTFDEMVELDFRYMRRWSFWFDLLILLRTIPAVVSGRGAY